MHEILNWTERKLPEIQSGMSKFSSICDYDNWFYSATLLVWSELWSEIISRDYKINGFRLNNNAMQTYVMFVFWHVIFIGFNPSIKEQKRSISIPKSIVCYLTLLMAY